MGHAFSFAFSFSFFTTTMKLNQIPSGEYGKRTTIAKSSHTIDMDNFSNYFAIYGCDQL